MCIRDSPKCTFTPPEGKEFAGWLAENGKVHPAGEVVTSSIDQSFKATWKDKAEVDVTQMFTDVTKNWAYPGIQYCVTHQLMSGVGGNLFAPKMTTTRAQIVQILYNLEGEPKVSGTTPFTDLTQNWYKDAVLWAYQTGVVSGTSATTFAPDLPVTREQIAVVLMGFLMNVYAVERRDDAVELLKKNQAAFHVENLTVVSGTAPEACRDLPAPTHVFIGGSAGNLRDILSMLLAKNPHVRIVATAVSLESIAELTACMKDFAFTEAEAVSVQIARGKKAGPYHLMTGQNPVYIFTMQSEEKP